MTDKLFYEDSYMENFVAMVCSCEKSGDGYAIVLDQTAFFPEGGGQTSDTGMLDDSTVWEVKEKDNIVYHYAKKALQVGTQVNGHINYKERFSKMQQHSGEHIVSGLVHEEYGYDNVGFHLGTEAVTMDFNGALTKEELREIEWKANEAVTKNLNIEVTYPSKEVLETLTYRSKIEIDGQVRIITVPGYDICACCAPHVKTTGEIGMIKLTGIQNYKGGVRVSMLCGFRALADYTRKEEQMKVLSGMLSAKEEVITEAVEKLQKDLFAAKIRCSVLQRTTLTYKAEHIEAQEKIYLFEEEFDADDARELMNLLLQKKVTVCAIFFGSEDDGYRYVIGSKSVDVREIAKRLNQEFDGRGGGKKEMVQGSLAGKRADIEKILI